MFYLIYYFIKTNIEVWNVKIYIKVLSNFAYTLSRHITSTDKKKTKILRQICLILVIIWFVLFVGKSTKQIEMEYFSDFL